MVKIEMDDLRGLMGRRDGWCISIYMPTHRYLPDSEQDPIRYKNLLMNAEQQLMDAGLRSPEVRELLKPAREMQQDKAFWRFQAGGLGVFVGPGGVSTVRLPFSFSEVVVVTNRFHLKPLLQALANERKFYVLALSQKKVRLLAGNGYSLEEVDLGGAPGEIGEILSRYDFENQLQYHAPTASYGRDSGIFHGHGVGIDDRKDKIEEYFRAIDSGVSKTLADSDAPLVTAMVDNLFPIYRRVNTYPHLLDQVISGNPDLLKPEDLHEKALKIVEPEFDKPRTAATFKYNQLAGTGNTSNEIAGIVTAAVQGRVESLFVAIGVQIWGSYDPDLHQTLIRNKQEPGHEDLLDLAALHTFLNGGRVFVIEPDKIPGNTQIAAVFRY